MPVLPARGTWSLCTSRPRAVRARDSSRSADWGLPQYTMRSPCMPQEPWIHAWHARRIAIASGGSFCISQNTPRERTGRCWALLSLIAALARRPAANEWKNCNSTRHSNAYCALRLAGRPRPLDTHTRHSSACARNQAPRPAQACGPLCARNCPRHATRLVPRPCLPHPPLRAAARSTHH